VLTSALIASAVAEAVKVVVLAIVKVVLGVVVVVLFVNVVVFYFALRPAGVRPLVAGLFFVLVFQEIVEVDFGFAGFWNRLRGR
jgi:hypothetical protein